MAHKTIRDCTAPLTHTAIYHDESEAIYGYGATPEEAWADARQWLSDGDRRDNLQPIDCTAALAATGRGGRGEFRSLWRDTGRGLVIDGACSDEELS